MAFSLFPLESFPSESFAVVFNIVFIIVLLAELRILLRQKKSGGKDKNSLILLLFGIFLPLIITIFLSYKNIGTIDSKISYLGTLVMIIGFLLRQYSIFILGKFFIPVVSIQKSQKLIERGPYRYIRHPSYTGLFLELAGFAFMLSNIIGLLLVIMLFIPTIIYRIKKEEQFLSQHLKGYKEYVKSTYRLFPCIY